MYTNRRTSAVYCTLYMGTKTKRHKRLISHLTNVRKYPTLNGNMRHSNPPLQPLHHGRQLLPLYPVCSLSFDVQRSKTSNLNLCYSDMQNAQNFQQTFEHNREKKWGKQPYDMHLLPILVRGPNVSGLNGRSCEAPGFDPQTPPFLALTIAHARPLFVTWRANAGKPATR